MKIQRKKFFWGGGGVGVGGGGGGWVGVGESWGGVRVDVNGELKFLGKFTQKISGGGGGGSERGVRLGGGVGLVGGSGWM